jgi:hypothetical protein
LKRFLYIWMLVYPHFINVLHILDGCLLHLCLNRTEIPLFIYVLHMRGRVAWAFPES